jgi:hypothetical protein
MNIIIIEYLQSVEISHSFAKNYKHGVQSQGEWDLFEPTRFVYAFFAFNMIYAIDWKLSVENGKILKNESNYFAKNQFEALIDFINSDNTTLFEIALDELDAKRELFSIISEMNFDKNSNKKNHRNTGNKIAKDFLLASEKFSNNEPLNKDDHFDLLQMSYAVRNNLFHGEKKAVDMKKQGHRNRLFHYANIILATNESFFEVMKIKHRYRRMEDWEIQNNL